MAYSNLILGDCLIAMKDISDGSIDLVLTDPPYGTTACKWDTVIPFEPMWEQLKRITKLDMSVAGNKDCTLHPTQKPVALMEYLIKTYTNEGETVLDFTMGSGTTGVACKNLNRNFIGIELDEEYFKIAEKRIKQAQR